jgi:hypothetical protein
MIHAMAATVHIEHGTDGTTVTTCYAVPLPDGQERALNRDLSLVRGAEGDSSAVRQP